MFFLNLLMGATSKAAMNEIMRDLRLVSSSPIWAHMLLKACKFYKYRKQHGIIHGEYYFIH